MVVINDVGHMSERTVRVPTFQRTDLDIKMADIVLLKMKFAIEYTKTVQPVQLPGYDTRGEESYVLYGWGLTKDERGAGASNTLQKLTGTTMPLRECGMFSDVFENIICTRPVKGHTMCLGDSGSGLLVEGRLAGVASRVSLAGCSAGVPEMYTNVYKFLPWIHDTMKKG